MERENLDSVLRNAKRLCDTQTSVIYETVDGRIYKHFKSIALMLDRSAGMRIAEKIDYADKIVDFDELYKPTSAVYSNGHFCGFTSKRIMVLILMTMIKMLLKHKPIIYIII